MGKFKALLVAGGIAIGLGGPALAADLLPPPPPVDVPIVAPIETGGWYLRGDVGVGVNQMSSLRSTLQPFNPAGGAAPWISTAYSNIGDSALIDFGVGYQINNWFRADVTGEYRSSAAYRKGVGYAGCGGFCLDTYTANISSALFMANGYVDLGTWYGVTPYVGVGLGVASNYWMGMTDVGLGSGYANNRTSTNLAWALMAGLSYNVSQNLKIDASYRYIDMGTANSNPITCGVVAGCFFETQSFHRTAQDFRLGFRYMLGEAAPVIAPGPLVRKY